MTKIRIGTRPSKLALAQTAMVIESLTANPSGFEFETVVIKTSGDSKQNAGNAVARDKRDWIEELESAILKGEIDLAVHSGKDVPYDISNQTSLQSVLERADSRDIFIGKLKSPKPGNLERLSFTELPQGSCVGTSSLRRRAQLLILRPDLEIKELRGNVPTRIGKLDSDRSYHGIVLASAGLDRLEISTEFMDLVPTELMLPASAQGILTVQYKKDRLDIAELAEQIKSKGTEVALVAERSAIRCLEADCASAVAVHAQVVEDLLVIKGRVFSNQESDFIEASAKGSISEPEELGIELGKTLIARGAMEMLRS